MLFCLKTETKLASKTSCFFKKLDDVQKNKIVSVNFGHAVFFHLSVHDDLAMQALVRPPHGPVQNDLVWHSMMVLHT